MCVLVCVGCSFPYVCVCECGGIRIAKELNKNGYTQKQQHLSTIYMVYYIVIYGSFIYIIYRDISVSVYICFKVIH